MHFAVNEVVSAGAWFCWVRCLVLVALVTGSGKLSWVQIFVIMVTML